MQQEGCRLDTMKNFRIVRVSTLTSRTPMFTFSGFVPALGDFINTRCPVQTKMEMDSVKPYSSSFFRWCTLPTRFPSCSAFDFEVLFMLPVLTVLSVVSFFVSLGRPTSS